MQLDQFKELEPWADWSDCYEFCFHACRVPSIDRKMTCVLLAAQVQEKAGPA